MNNELEVLKAIPPKVVEEVYSDGVSNTLREVSKLGVDAVKTMRLALFPLQLAGSLQDRLASYIDRSLKRVPEPRRIAPAESLALQITERLRFQEDGSILTEMYVNLLARAMDKDRVGEAHPAFILIVTQLAPDEVLLLNQIFEIGLSAYMRLPKHSDEVLGKKERYDLISTTLPEPYGKEFCKLMVRPEELASPSLIFTYIEHLVSLGIVIYTNEKNIYTDSKRHIPHWDCWFIQLNEFGRLFHSACLGDTDNPALKNRDRADPSSE